MGKRSDSLLTYTYTDSERLKEAFFSPPKKKKTGFAAVKKFVISFLAIILIAVSAFLFLRYDLIIVSKNPVNIMPPGVSLLADAKLSSFKLFKGTSQLTTEKPTPIDITLANNEKVMMVVDLNSPLDLRENLALLHLKKANIPLNMEVIVRDKRFFSNSLNPLKVKIDSKSPFLGALKIPINFKESNMQNVNLSQVNQLKIYFWIPKNLEPTNESALSQRAEWIVIKDLVIAKKEGI